MTVRKTFGLISRPSRNLYIFNRNFIFAKVVWSKSLVHTLCPESHLDISGESGQTKIDFVGDFEDFGKVG